MRTCLALLALLLWCPVALAQPGPHDVEEAARRMWARPALVLTAGLNQAPAAERGALTRALEFTARSAKLETVEWTPAATASSDGVLRGDLRVRATGVMPPSTCVLTSSVSLLGLGLDAVELTRRRAIRFVEPGRFEAQVRLPLDLLGALNRGLHVTARDGRLELRGRRTVLFLDLSFKLDGTLACPDRVHLNLRPSALSIISIPAPGPVRSALIDAVNPVFCVDAALGPLAWLVVAELDDVRVKPDALELDFTGRLRMPGDPEPAPPHHPPRRPK